MNYFHLAAQEIHIAFKNFNQCCFELVNAKALPGPEVIKLFLCSTLLIMDFVLLITLKLLAFEKSFLLNIAEHEIFSANKYENANYCEHFHAFVFRRENFVLS